MKVEENSKVLQLYPATGKTVSVRGLYLRDDLVAGNTTAGPKIVANFLSSIDGRIAVRSPGSADYDLPKQLKSVNDFQLFLELHACSDCIVTHSGYLRALQEGRHGNVLQLPTGSEYEYLHSWRQQQKLDSSPDIVILSSNLDFPLEPAWLGMGQKALIVTGQKHDVEARKRWQARGYEVYVLPCADYIDADELKRFLISQAYRTVYLVAGPLLLQSMLAHALVDNLFLTIRHHILGGEDFHTLIPEHLLGDEGGLCLENMYLDQSAGPAQAQWFCEFSMLTGNR